MLITSPFIFLHLLILTNEHQITLPPELVQQWRTAPEYTTGAEKLTMVSMTTRRLQEIADQSAQYGADQELEACCHLLRQQGFDVVDDLRATRRPKPLSLKQQALATLEEEPEADDMKELIVFDTAQVEIIRRALEALPE